MGGCLSSNKDYLSKTDGGEEDFHNKYLEDCLLGEGEFGVVKLVHDMSAPKNAIDGESPPLACKILRKGVQFKDNVLYAPLKPEILRAECDMLRVLQGKHYCLRLIKLYESPKHIYLVTELCAGGEMMEYVSQQDELRTEDVSRIAFQMLDAVHHCASHNIIHRDIKPENCMFVSNQAGSELRLIDFGSGCMDTTSTENEMHSTFAGSAFYISPEMFQRTYTQKTDVWSVGVALYVLVAGYPADELQKAFNLLHKSKNRNLRQLPNLPTDLPDSYYELLEELLQYRHKARKSAGDLLQHEFVQFHKQHFDISIQDVVEDSLTTTKNNRTKSMKLTSSVKRHSLFLDFKKYERSVTTLIATLLSKEDFDALVKRLEERNNKGKLNIIPIRDLKGMLKDMKQDKCVQNIEKLPNASSYENFAYHVELLTEFVRTTPSTKYLRRFSSSIDEKSSSSVHGSNAYKEMKKFSSFHGSSKKGDRLNNSWHLGQQSG